MVRFEAAPGRRALTGQLLWFLLWAGVVVAALFMTPDPSGRGTHTQLGLPPCPSTLVLRGPCPGCGLTTSITALVQGNTSLSFAAHPLGALVFAVFTLTAWAALYGWLTGRRLVTNTRAFNWALVVLFAVFLAFGTWRYGFSESSRPTTLLKEAAP